MHRKESIVIRLRLARIKSLLLGIVCLTIFAGLFGLPNALAVEAPTKTTTASKNDPFQLSNTFRMPPFGAGLLKGHPPQLHFKNDSDPVAWSKIAKAKFIQLLGLPIKKVDLRPVTQSQGTFTVANNSGQTFTYTREAVQFMSQAGLPAFGYLLLPANAKDKLPCIICTPGHSGGVDEICGVNSNGTTRNKYSIDYQHDLAIQCVNRGYAVLALESLGSGRLQDKKQPPSNPQDGQCQRFSSASLIVGQTLTGWNVNQVIRGIDYLQTRPEIDATRIATLGISRGAQTAMYAAAVDTRIKCAVVASYLNDWQVSLLAYNHCICNFIPGIANYLKMSDIAGLIAPRFLICECSTDDYTFLYEGAKKAFEEAKAIYKAFGCADHATLSVGTGHHVFRGEDCFEQLKKHL